jgi:hypothetical protein
VVESIDDHLIQLKQGGSANEKMVISTRPVVQLGSSLKSLINGFVLTKQTDGKSPRTVEFYSENLKRFLWYSLKKQWPDDIRMISEWDIRDFLGYVANETNRWGLVGNGSEPAQRKVSHATVHHYFVVLANFFGWVRISVKSAACSG